MENLTNQIFHLGEKIIMGRAIISYAEQLQKNFARSVVVLEHSVFEIQEITL